LVFTSIMSFIFVWYKEGKLESTRYLHVFLDLFNKVKALIATEKCNSVDIFCTLFK